VSRFRSDAHFGIQGALACQNGHPVGIIQVPSALAGTAAEASSDRSRIAWIK
jgi:hypothetical protein